ncbi:MAG: DCC1-like thiol-disulfide oxidoreductase family protein [Kiritimatiellia bacterium]|nr:DCC1-like thiol-disulfide oxidoreductase family protein [Kiritimatiellia bacterium]MDP6629853.1 DCC1-like thiol-disulfide oxidoreductase family protein [Kiritimatiellia bacterium]MDP6809724.1 DCC1-like thiol-disulfide oxidoreductase family protein [Kiritimatiellia bacterium]MDP7025166.1 DCC1-like thiol-disulfide oxidoreductase family protein [Kiritimatiellia bacterium]
MTEREAVLFVYDGECPACRAYSQAVRIRESVGELRLVNAREDADIVAEIAAQGFDIDQGMALKIGTQWYTDADAIHALALIGTRSNLFNRLNSRIFRSKQASVILYPMLRGIRNLLLKLLGRSKIANAPRG